MDDDDLMMTGRPSAPMRRIDWLIVGVDLARQMTEALLGALSNAEMLLCGHANHKVDQATFEDEARRQIESMTEE